MGVCCSHDMTPSRGPAFHTILAVNLPPSSVILMSVLPAPTPAVMKMWPSSRTTGEGDMVGLTSQDSSHSRVPSLPLSADSPTIFAFSALYTYAFFPLRVMGVIDEWDKTSP